MISNKLFSNKKGFTLIELIIAMAILAIVTRSVLGAFTRSQKRGRDAQRKSDLKQIQNALEAYANDHNGRYPDVSNGQIVSCPANRDVSQTDGAVCTWGESEFKVSEGAVYMTRIPKDPSDTNYYYVVASNNTSYQLYACLENDQDLCFSADSQNCDSNGFAGTSCGACGGGALCTYGVSSANTTP